MVICGQLFRVAPQGTPSGTPAHRQMTRLRRGTAPPTSHQPGAGLGAADGPGVVIGGANVAALEWMAVEIDDGGEVERPGPRRRTLSLVHRVREPGMAGPGRPPRLVLFHGVGSNELSMALLADSFDPRFLVISARSPIQVGPFGFAWFHVTFTPDGPVIDADEAEAGWRRVIDFVEEAAIAYDADPDRIFVAGFSQGGIVALAAMLTTPERFAGAVCMSGRLPPEVLPHIASDERLHGKPVLIVHGTTDETLPVGFGRQARATLETKPLDLVYREFPMGHTTTPDSIRFVDEWLRARLGN
jgi:phospholipase/carboxylesterase